MKYMKRLLVVCLLGCLCLSGCGKKQEENTKTVYYDLSKIENTLKTIDSNLVDTKSVDAEMLKSKYNFNTSDMEEFLIVLPTLSDHASMYMIVKPKAGKKNVAKEEIAKFFETYETQYNVYFPEEENLIQNRLEKEQDGYLFYFVSEKQDEFMNVINANRQDK